MVGNMEVEQAMWWVYTHRSDMEEALDIEY
jgi:hypothetical protein